MKSLLIYCFILLLKFTSCNTDSQNQDLIDSIETRMEELIMQNDLPGMALSIIYSEGKQINCSAGYADIERGILVGPGALVKHMPLLF